VVTDGATFVVADVEVMVTPTMAENGSAVSTPRMRPQATVPL